MKLPILQEVFTRTLRMVDGENVIYVQSELESLLGFDRPVNWGEHATIGAPFLEAGVTTVDMSAKRAQTRPYPEKPQAIPLRLASAKDFTWPMAPLANGKKVDLRASPAKPNSLDHTTCLMDPSRKLVFVAALNPSKRLILGYVFRREDYPWTQSWELYPADLRMARGMEFATQPYDVPRRETVQTNSHVRNADVSMAAGEIENREPLPAVLRARAGGLSQSGRCAGGRRQAHHRRSQGEKTNHAERVAAVVASVAREAPGIETSLDAAA